MPGMNVNFMETVPQLNGALASAIVVDDDPSSCLLLTKTLHRMGIEAVSCNNGKDALNILRNSPAIKLIITDIEMPIMNGYEVVKTITELNNSGNLHADIVVMSSLDPADYYNKMGEYPIKGFLQKPVRMQNLSLLLIG